jgi:hypothetical protein
MARAITLLIVLTSALIFGGTACGDGSEPAPTSPSNPLVSITLVC